MFTPDFCGDVTILCSLGTSLLCFYFCILRYAAVFLKFIYYIQEQELCMVRILRYIFMYKLH